MSNVADGPTIELTPSQLPAKWSSLRAKSLAAGEPATDVPSAANAPGLESHKRDELIGHIIGGFKILRVLGAGSMGTVYLAEQMALRRPVALKVLNEVRASRNNYLARFTREAHAVARLIHPNAVQVYNIGHDQGYHFLALEYVDGQSLADMLSSRGRLPWKASLEIVRQAANSLVRAHDLGIVHRDIKPGNILINRHADVKVADFGLALLDGEPAITEHGSILGTPLYMSPEQARGRAVGPAADLYSLGCTLYHMVTGVPPFDEPDPMSVLLKQLKEYPRAPHLMVKDVPQHVSELIMRLLAKEPYRRYSSARSLVEAISAARKGPTAPESRPPAGPDKRDSGAELQAVARVASRQQLQRIREVALSREGMRQLLAFEATRACLTPRPRRAFLQATMRNYRIPLEDMMPLLEKPLFSRDDIWELQLLKRKARGNLAAVRAIIALRDLEKDLGRSLLQTCVEGNRNIEGPGSEPRIRAENS